MEMNEFDEAKKAVAETEPEEGFAVDIKDSDTAEPAITPEVSEAPAAAGKRRSLLTETYDLLDTLLYSVLAIIVIFTFFTRMSTVDGNSMLPTLEDGQRLMITDFLYTPAYNDIVVVWADGIPNDNGDYGKAIVKRVIGLPGDRISIDFKEGRVTRNGTLLDIESRDGFLYEDGHKINSYTNLEEGLGGEFLVPEGCIFVMGDNRNGSTDSRSSMVGFVDRREIIGKAYLRVIPFGKFGGLY
ncbi:MAG: signal peptidase I [Ruminiclostridium sp.]|nr:signal peptidase I [Ruminiclostridium sp.]